MPIIQESFYIEPTMAEGIASGRFVRTRPGVVRIAKGYPGAGQIVKELEWIPSKDHADEKALKEIYSSKNAFQGVTSFVSNNKRAIIIIAGVAVLAVTVAGAIYISEKKREPKELKEVRKRYNEYMTAVRAGRLDYRVVEYLANAIDDLRKLKNFKKLKFQLTAEEFCELTSTIMEYTKELAEKNNYKLVDRDELIQTGDSIYDLRRYLELQKRIIVEAS